MSITDSEYFDYAQSLIKGLKSISNKILHKKTEQNLLIDFIDWGEKM